jgi:rubrerythrin
MEGGIDAWRGVVATGGYDHGLWTLKGVRRSVDVISLALALEEGARIFYGRVREILPDGEAKGLFGSLVKAEEEHKRRLAEAYSAMASGSGEEIPAENETLKGFMEGPFSIDETLKWVSAPGRTYLEVVELSMQVESDSLDFYLKIAGREEFTPVRDILEDLIRDEKAHLRRLGAHLEKAFESRGHDLPEPLDGKELP